MDNATLSRYVYLVGTRRELEDRLEAVKENIARLEEQVLEDMVGAGLQSLRTEQGETVYLHRQLWANAEDGDYPRACAALEAAGLGGLVQPRFNSNSLSAWCRERDAAGVPLPACFDGAIKVSEKVSVRVRR